MQLRTLVRPALRSGFVSGLLTPRSVDDYLELFTPIGSLRDVRARVVRIEHENADAVSLFLQPNRNWQRFLAGQFVALSVPIEGVWHTRCFSLSSAPEDGLPLRLTLKLVPGGRVTGWAKFRARAGDVVRLSQAGGEFVLPNPIPPRLLFISAGSGITPVISLLRQLTAIGHDGEVALLHYARGKALFAHELDALARRHSGLRLDVRSTLAAGGAGARFCRRQLEKLVPEWRAYETFVCGPAALMSAVRELWDQAGLARRLRQELFVREPPPQAEVSAARHKIDFARSRLVIDGSGSCSLLEQAELAGLHPLHGCRIGICHGCVHRKLSGVTRHELTGQVSTKPAEIQLCVSRPCSDVTLDL